MVPYMSPTCSSVQTHTHTHSHSDLCQGERGGDNTACPLLLLLFKISDIDIFSDTSVMQNCTSLNWLIHKFSHMISFQMPKSHSKWRDASLEKKKTWLLLPLSVSLFGRERGSDVFVVSPQQPITRCLLSAAFFSSLGSSFLYGYNLSVVNAPAVVSPPIPKSTLLSNTL